VRDAISDVASIGDADERRLRASRPGAKRASSGIGSHPISQFSKEVIVPDRAWVKQPAMHQVPVEQFALVTSGGFAVIGGLLLASDLPVRHVPAVGGHKDEQPANRQLSLRV
jgi:hypothetical protein